MIEHEDHEPAHENDAPLPTSSDGLTEAEIMDALQAMVSRNLKVTQVSLRNYIGRGSYSQIGPVLRAWRQNERLQAKPESSVPEDIRLAAEESMETLWAAALLACERGLAEDKASLDRWFEDQAAVVTEIEKENAALAAKQDFFEKAVNQERETNLHLREQIANLESKLYQIGLESNSNRERADVLEQQNTRLEKRFDTLTEAHQAVLSEKAGTEALLAESKRKVQSLESMVEKITDQIDLERTTVGRLANELQQANHALEQSQSHAAELDRKLDTHKAALVESQRECIQLDGRIQELTKVERHAVDLQQQLEEVQETLSAGQMALQQAKHDKGQLQKALDDAKNQNVTLGEKLEALEVVSRDLRIQLARSEAREQTLDRLMKEFRMEGAGNGQS